MENHSLFVEVADAEAGLLVAAAAAGLLSAGAAGLPSPEDSAEADEGFAWLFAP